MRTNRSSWDTYFMSIADLVATRSTCLSLSVGAVIVKDKQILATGYNGPPSDSPHCNEQGFCYSGVGKCGESTLPSRAIHAEANAIAQAAKYGVSIDGATIYVTHEPCLYCLKLIISAGIKTVIYREDFNSGDKIAVRNMLSDGLVELRKFKR